MSEVVEKQLSEFFAVRPEVQFACLLAPPEAGEKGASCKLRVAVLLAEERQTLPYQVHLLHDLKQQAEQQIEIVFLNQAPLAVRLEAFRRGQVLYSRDECQLARQRFETYRDRFDQVPAATDEQSLTVDRARQAAALEDYLAILRQMPRYTLEELTADRIKLWAVERGLQLATQSLLDLGHSLLQECGVAVEQPSKTIELLGQQEIIPRQLAEELSWVAPLREALVSNHSNLKAAQVYQAFNIGLEQMARFLHYAGKRLGAGGAS